MPHSGRITLYPEVELPAVSDKLPASGVLRRAWVHWRRYSLHGVAAEIAEEVLVLLDQPAHPGVPGGNPASFLQGRRRPRSR